jgi:hypothetical protein
MTTELETAQCKNCYRKLGTVREIIKSGTGVWVHNNPIHYDLKCHIWEEYVAEPMEEE